MGARVYIPGIGRFLQVDPVEGGVENNYVYPVNPVNKTDLSGMCPMCVPLGIIAVRAAMHAAAKHAAKQAAKKAAQEAAKRAAKEAAKSWKKLSPQMVKKLESKGIIKTHGRGSDKIGGSKQDIFVDKKTGQLYAKPKNGSGPGEPLGANIKDLK
jgi:hypothetical protein